MSTSSLSRSLLCSKSAPSALHYHDDSRSSFPSKKGKKVRSEHSSQIQRTERKIRSTKQNPDLPVLYTLESFRFLDRVYLGIIPSLRPNFDDVSKLSASKLVNRFELAFEAASLFDCECFV